MIVLISSIWKYPHPNLLPEGEGIKYAQFPLSLWERVGVRVLSREVP
jgi:hypothetical protein